MAAKKHVKEEEDLIAAKIPIDMPKNKINCLSIDFKP